jgi:hypothetical protein
MGSFNRANVQRFMACSLMALAMLCFVTRPAEARRPEREIDKIVKAIDALDKAQEELSSAGHDFHGHKQAAMEKIAKAKEVLESSRDARVEKAADKVQAAIDELKTCVEGDKKDDHPRIHEAMRTLEDAKEQL